MICQFCRKKIKKGKKASKNRMRMPRQGGGPGLFIHTKCLDPWRVRERIRGNLTDGMFVQQSASAGVYVPPLVEVDPVSFGTFLHHAAVGTAPYKMSAIQVELYKRIAGGGK